MQAAIHDSNEMSSSLRGRGKSTRILNSSVLPPIRPIANINQANTTDHALYQQTNMTDKKGRKSSQLTPDEKNTDIFQAQLSQATVALLPKREKTPAKLNRFILPFFAVFLHHYDIQI